MRVCRMQTHLQLDVHCTACVGASGCADAWPCRLNLSKCRSLIKLANLKHDCWLQALFEELQLQAAYHKLQLECKQIDPPSVKQGVFGQLHDYEGGFVMLTVRRC